MMFRGYTAHAQPGVRTAHAASLFSNISGVHFVVPVLVPGQMGEGAVLVGLTQKAASAFQTCWEKGRIDLKSAQQLHWQIMPLNSVRSATKPQTQPLQ